MPLPELTRPSSYTGNYTLKVSISEPTGIRDITVHVGRALTRDEARLRATEMMTRGFWVETTFYTTLVIRKGELHDDSDR